MIRIPGAALALLLAACAAPDADPPTTSPTGSRIHTIAGRDLLEIPAGEFDLGERRLYLPTFFIEVEPGPPAPGLVPADEFHLQKAMAERYGLEPRIGIRHVLHPPAPEYRGVQWRPDFWGAVEEARRRNSILFVTLHWDG